MKSSIGLSPSRLVPTHFAALLASSSSLLHALSGLLTSATRFASPRGLKEKREHHSMVGVVMAYQRMRERSFPKGSVRSDFPKDP